MVVIMAVVVVVVKQQKSSVCVKPNHLHALVRMHAGESVAPNATLVVLLLVLLLLLL